MNHKWIRQFEPNQQKGSTMTEIFAMLAISAMMMAVLFFVLPTQQLKSK
jgi:hypothetical protein